MQEERILEKANENAGYFRELVSEYLINHKHVGEIRSIGLINAIELVKDRSTGQPFDSKQRVGYQIYKKALAKGVVLRPLGDVLYFNPPLTINREEMDFVALVCKECIGDVLG